MKNKLSVGTNPATALNSNPRQIYWQKALEGEVLDYSFKLITHEHLTLFSFNEWKNNRSDKIKLKLENLGLMNIAKKIIRNEYYKSKNVCRRCKSNTKKVVKSILDLYKKKVIKNKFKAYNAFVKKN